MATTARKMHAANARADPRSCAHGASRGALAFAYSRGAPSPARYTRVHQHVIAYTHTIVCSHTHTAQHPPYINSTHNTLTRGGSLPPCTLDRPQHRRRHWPRCSWWFAVPRRTAPGPGPSSKSPPLTSAELARPTSVRARLESSCSTERAGGKQAKRGRQADGPAAVARGPRRRHAVHVAVPTASRDACARTRAGG